MSSDTTERVDLAVAIERIGKSTAVIASFSVVISVFYDWGFFFALDISFAEAPTTISDHVRSWLVWLPKIGILVLVFLAIELLIRRLEKGMTEEELIESSSNPTWTKKFRRSHLIAFDVVGILVIIFWLLFGNMFSDGLYVGGIVCWLLFIGWVFEQRVVRERHPAPFRSLICWGPVLMTLVFAFGFTEAKSATNSAGVLHRLQMTVPEGSAGQHEARVLRSFEKWVLIREKHGQIAWVRSDDIRRIERTTAETPFRGLICALFGKLCLSGDSSKTK